MSMRVLAGPEAIESATRMRQTIEAGLDSELSALESAATRLSDPNVWDGPHAVQFREVWREMAPRLRGAQADLQAQELKRLGCRHAQGYFFSPPLSSPRVEQMLAARQPLGQKQLETAQRDAIARDLEPFFGPPSPPPPSHWTH